MDCRRRHLPPEMPLHQAVHAASQIGEHDPLLAIGLARTLTNGAFTPLLDVDGVVAHMVADATDTLDDAMRLLADEVD